MTINDIFRKICDEPENDAVRLEYANLIESSDPAHGKLPKYPPGSPPRPE